MAKTNLTNQRQVHGEEHVHSGEHSLDHRENSCESAVLKTNFLNPRKNEIWLLIKVIFW